MYLMLFESFSSFEIEFKLVNDCVVIIIII